MKDWQTLLGAEWEAVDADYGPQTQAVVNADEFLTWLPIIPWFAHVGQPLSDSNIPRIWDWDAWAGPEEETGRIITLSLRHQDWHDALLTAHPEREAELRALWQRAAEAVLCAAQDKLPYDPHADAWHAPSMAVWQAQWTAGLIAWYLACGVPIPADLAQQWDWYARGHWPCGYATLTPEGEPGPLEVY